MIKKAFENDSVSEAMKKQNHKKQLELVLQNWAGTLILEGLQRTEHLKISDTCVLQSKEIGN